MVWPFAWRRCSSSTAATARRKLRRHSRRLFDQVWTFWLLLQPLLVTAFGNGEGDDAELIGGFFAGEIEGKTAGSFDDGADIAGLAKLDAQDVLQIGGQVVEIEFVFCVWFMRR